MVYAIYEVWLIKTNIPYSYHCKKFSTLKLAKEYFILNEIYEYVEYRNIVYIECI